jgi:serine/threonine protein kinase
MSLLIDEFCDIKPLENGGAGSIYLATEIIQNRKVVIKKLPLIEPKDSELIHRLETKVKSAAGLNHDNIIRVFDFGKEASSFFIAMEYMNGLDLGRLMQGRPFRMEIGLMVLLQSLRGLRHAHSQGIVHSNVKPGNILISKNGKVKIADFGFNHAGFSAAEFKESSSDFMTLHYMPPEAVDGSRDEDIAMDIWSTGVLAFHIISGSLPFVGSDFQNLVHAIVHDDVKDVRTVDPTLPEELAGEVNACLEKNPHNRPASVDRLLQSVEKFLADLGVRDNEKMIMNYIADKDLVDKELADLVLHYYAKKNEFISAKDHIRPKALFSGSGVPINTPEDEVLPERKPFHRSSALFDTIIQGERANVVLDSALIALLIIISVLVIGSSKREGGLSPYRFALSSKPPYGNVGQKPETMAPAASRVEKKIVADNSPPSHDSALVNVTMKNPDAPANPGGKKAKTSRITIQQKSIPDEPSEEPVVEEIKGIGSLHIYSYPWAEIYVDDSYQGTSPTPKPISLPEGKHTVLLKREGFKPDSETVDISPDEAKRMKVQLERLSD